MCNPGLRISILSCLLTCLTIGHLKAQAPDVEKLKALSLEELLEVEVTSVSKRKEKLTETASAIQVISSQDIRRSGATSVPEALRLLTNLQVAQVNASQWAISARGFNNVLANKLLVLIDGRVVYTPMYAGVFWDVQNLLLEDIDRIEVISGPGGTLWGANAVNGVINIITKTSAESRGLYVEAAAGTELKGLGSIRYGGKINDDLDFRVYGTGFKRDNTIFQDSVDANDDWQMAQGGLRLDWTPGKADVFTFLGNLYDGRPDPDGNNPVVAQGNNFLARWTRSISEHSDVQVQTYYDYTWRDFRNGFAEKLTTFDIEAQHRSKIGRRHELIYGLGFRSMNHNVTNLELFAFRPAQKSLYLFNVFAQDEIEIVPEKLRAVLGLKVEHHTYTSFQYQPNVRIAFTPRQNQTLWAAISRAVRNPARIDREFFLDLAPGLSFISGSEFEPEEVLAYEAGWRRHLGNKFSTSISAFFNAYDNIRSVEPGPAPFGIPVTFGNGVKGNSYGVELSLSGHINKWWSVRGGYTYLEKDLYLKPGSADQNKATAESNDPNHQALVQSNMQVSEKIELSTVLRYVSELPEPHVSGYFGVDLRVALKLIEPLEISIVGQNLLSDHHTEFIPSSPAPKDIERSFYAKLVCRF